MKIISPACSQKCLRLFTSPWREVVCVCTTLVWFILYNWWICCQEQGEISNFHLSSFLKKPDFAPVDSIARSGKKTCKVKQESLFLQYISFAFLTLCFDSLVSHFWILLIFKVLSIYSELQPTSLFKGKYFTSLNKSKLLLNRVLKLPKSFCDIVSVRFITLWSNVVARRMYLTDPQIQGA